MAVIHISRAEAANDFDGLIARAGMGDEIIIEDASPVVLKRAVRQPGRLLSEIIATAEARGSNATLDEDFGRDLAGEEVLIGSEATPVAVLRLVRNLHVRLLSESLRILKERGSTVTLDADFGRDLEDIINSHREPLDPPAWD